MYLSDFRDENAAESGSATGRPATQLDEPVGTRIDFMRRRVVALIERHGEIERAVDVNQWLSECDVAKRALIGRRRVIDELVVVEDADANGLAQSHFHSVEKRLR